MIAERFRTNFSKKDTFELQGQILAKSGKGAGVISLIAHRQFSRRSGAKCAVIRTLTARTTGKLQYILGGDDWGIKVNDDDGDTGADNDVCVENDFHVERGLIATLTWMLFLTGLDMS
eukprot:764135-Hanusia_phi.AAC.2